MLWWNSISKRTVVEVLVVVSELNFDDLGFFSFLIVVVKMVGFFNVEYVFLNGLSHDLTIVGT